MCYYKQNTATKNDLEIRYNEKIDFDYKPVYLDGGFSFRSTPVLIESGFKNFNWGLIPFWAKSKVDADAIKTKTLNCISEEMYDKPSFKHSLKDNKRCLIPSTGFFEWQDFNKKKYPYFIHLKSTSLFSLAGLYNVWTDKSTGEEIGTYTVLTTKANPLMERVHNLKKRMPVILPKEFEKDWLNPNLTKEDVLALCTPYPESDMEAYTITKLLTDRSGKDKNSAAINEPFAYPELV